MDENLAVLLGLGLGGIGGYFGSKNRRESEAERLAMLLDAQKPDPNVESDAIKLFKLQEAERKRIREENLLREQQAKADAEALDEEYYSLGDIFVDPFTKGIKKDSIGIPDFLQEGPLVDAASKLFGLAEEGLDNVTSGPLADKVRAGRDKFGEFIANNLVSGPAVDAVSDQLGQFKENLISGPAVDAVSDQFRQLEENLPVTGKAIYDYIYDSGGQLQEDLSGAYDTLYNLGAGTNELYNKIIGIPDNLMDAGRDKFDSLMDFADYAGIFNKGGRVGLANGGLGYSYKNNIFSADPSTGIPAIVDAGGDDGVADDTFLNLYPGLFPPVTDPVEKIMDTPAVPMGGGGDGGLNNPLSGNYTGGSNIPFGENPMYGPSSGYDPDDPENSFLDKLGYGFYSNVALPTATMMKKNPLSLANIIGSVFGDKDGDGDDVKKDGFKLSDIFSNPDPNYKTNKTNKTKNDSQGDGGSGGINSKDPKGGIGGGYGGKGPGQGGSIHG